MQSVGRQRSLACSPVTAKMTTMACAKGYSSVSESSIAGERPAGVSATRRRAAPPVRRRNGFPEVQIVDLHVAPGHALAEARAERLGARLLGGVALRVAAGAVDVAVAAAALEVRVHTLAESVAPALQRTLEAADIEQVGADAQDHPLGLAKAALIKPGVGGELRPSAPASARCSPPARERSPRRSGSDRY